MVINHRLISVNVNTVYKEKVIKCAGSQWEDTE